MIVNTFVCFHFPFCRVGKIIGLGISFLLNARYFNDIQKKDSNRNMSDFTVIYLVRAAYYNIIAPYSNYRLMVMIDRDILPGQAGFFEPWNQSNDLILLPIIFKPSATFLRWVPCCNLNSSVRIIREGDILGAMNLENLDAAFIPNYEG